MDIFILRDGEQTGPFSEQDTQRLVKLGHVQLSDRAWHEGLPEWMPLSDVLASESNPATSEENIAPPPVPAPSRGGGEPATPKQRAFLAYMNVPVPLDLTKEQAALLGNDVMEDPKNSSRMAKWNVERLKLHPDIFAQEVLARKEERIQHYYEVCQTEGDEILNGVTKAHCQVLVGYLDVKFPNWDANPSDAPSRYFFPAVAEKFPQLVREQWKDRLEYSQGPKVSPELKRNVAASSSRSPVRKTSSPVASLFKGLFLGLLLVGLVAAGIYLSRHPAEREALIGKVKGRWAESGQASADATKVAPAPSAPSPAPADKPAAGETAAAPAQSTPPPTETAMSAPAAQSAQMAGAPAAPPAPAAGDASMGNPPAAMGAPAPAPAAGVSLFDPTPPEPAAEKPADPSMAAAPGLPAPKTVARLTQTLEFQTQYGKVKVPAGTQLPIVEQDGLNVKVRFQNQVVPVPIAATDLAGDAAP